MQNIERKLAAIDWQRVTNNMNDKGFAIAENILSIKQCEELIEQYNHTGIYRKTVAMERYRFGLGEYKYFSYPLPGLLQTIREQVYPKLAPIANYWMQVLNTEKTFPLTFKELQALSHKNKQIHATVLMLKYGKGGHNTLHQDLYGDVFFPIQAVLFLNEPGEEYTGGEFVLVQQTPRAQSKAMVLTPHKGDMLFFTTSFRPVKGSKGYYRVNVKHGVSELHSGLRHTVGIIFHDALN